MICLLAAAKLPDQDERLTRVVDRCVASIASGQPWAADPRLTLLPLSWWLLVVDAAEGLGADVIQVTSAVRDMIEAKQPALQGNELDSIIGRRNLCLSPLELSRLVESASATEATCLDHLTHLLANALPDGPVDTSVLDLLRGDDVSRLVAVCRNAHAPQKAWGILDQWLLLRCEQGSLQRHEFCELAPGERTNYDTLWSCVRLYLDAEGEALDKKDRVQLCSVVNFGRLSPAALADATEHVFVPTRCVALAAVALRREAETMHALLEQERQDTDALMQQLERTQLELDNAKQRAAAATAELELARSASRSTFNMGISPSSLRSRTPDLAAKKIVRR